MSICDYRHEEIVFKGKSCPICEIVGEKDLEIEVLQGDLKALQKQIDNHVCVDADGRVPS